MKITDVESIIARLPEVREVHGEIQVPAGPGLGIELNEDTLARYRVAP